TRQDEQGHGVEVDSLVFGGHWATVMIRRGSGGVDRKAGAEGAFLPLKDGPDGLLESHGAPTSVLITGRCEPRCSVPGLEAPRRAMGRARRHHPPSGGLPPIPQRVSRRQPARSALRSPRKAQSEKNRTRQSAVP